MPRILQGEGSSALEFSPLARFEQVKSKSAAAEMLKGTRFPGKGVMVSFLQACGVPEGELEQWKRAWERIAAARTQMRPPGIPLSPNGPQAASPVDQQLLATAAQLEPQSHFVRYFSIDDEPSERIFYNELERHIEDAQ